MKKIKTIATLFILIVSSMVVLSSNIQAADGTKDTPEQFAFDLRVGLNLITIPVENDFTASTLLDAISNCDIISKWDVDKQSYIAYISGGHGYDFEIEDGVGYYVDISNESNFTVEGIALKNKFVDVVEGYNLLGRYQQEPILASSILTSLDHCVEVKAFDARNQEEMVYTDPSDDDFYINQGMGYFVKIEIPENLLIVNPTDDSSIDYKNSIPKGDRDYMKIRNKDGCYTSTWEDDGLVDFDLPSMPDGMQIKHATLKMFYFDYHDENPKGRDISLLKIIEDWDEETVMWFNQPATYKNVIATSKVPNQIGNWMKFDVTSDIIDAIENDSEFHGYMLCDLESWGQYDIPITSLRTKEYGSFIPTLEIEIEEIPDDVAPFTHCNLTGDLGENNWFTSDITAHLLAVDDFSGIKKISYRINDDIWQSVDYVNKELTRYITVNISTNGEHTLEYYSTDFQDNVESVKSKNIKIDKKSPSADITYNGTLGENGYYISEAVVVVSAQDLESGVKQISYIVNNNEEVIVEDDYAFVILNEGHHQIVFTVIDNAGNIKVLDPVKVSVDITPPETVAKIDYGATGDDSSVLVTLLAQDAISGVSKTFYKVDKVTDFKEYTEPFIVSGYGRHIVYFYSVDNAGLVEEEGYEKFIIKMDLFVRK